MNAEDNSPMHPTLKARVLSLARQYRQERSELEREARALVLCGPDCDAINPRFPAEHCHTYWDMLRSWEPLDYGWKLQQAQQQAEDMARMDVAPHLRRAGAGEVHIAGLTRLDESRPAMAAVRKWLMQPRPVDDRGQPGPMPFPWLALLGVTDAGKTQAAVAVLAHFVRRHPWNTGAGGGRSVAHQPFVLVHGAELAAVARNLRDFGAAEAAREREEELRRAKVLVLDDVGAERMDPDTMGLLHAIADYRYRERKVTVWTANAKPTDLERRLDFANGDPDEKQRGRLWRRIRELGAVLQLGKTTAKMTMGEATHELGK